MEGALYDFIEQLSTAPLINYLNDDDGLDDFDFSSDPWAKFKLDDFGECPSVNDLFADLDGFFEEKNVLNHDCMWAGHCGGKEHADEPHLSGLNFKPPIIYKDPPMAPPLAIIPQESLLKPSVKAMNTTLNELNATAASSLQTPPDSDDDSENKINSAVLLRMLSDDSNECDSDFAEYLIGDEVEEKQETLEMKQEDLDIIEESLNIKAELEDTESETESRRMSCEEYRIRTQWAAENDHSYYKDKNAAMINHNYGLDTPSDSEDEEIDVVSVPDKYMLASRAPLSLPTNPSFKDRHQIQKTMASAMSKNRSNPGIKTILPVRNSDAQTTSGRRRGGKRGRGNRASSAYKRKRTNNIVEAEPTDKRHLHNDMERQRRVDLRIAFDNLKAVVPEVSGTKKIAKVNILLQAAQYCYQLTSANANNLRQMEQLKKRQVWLRSRVSQLRRDLAARR